MREATVHTVYITVQYMSGEVGATISDSAAEQIISFYRVLQKDRGFQISSEGH